MRLPGNHNRRRRRRSNAAALNLKIEGTHTVNFNWNWKGLITAVVTAILGWLSSAVVPVPGSSATTIETRR